MPHSGSPSGSLAVGTESGSIPVVLIDPARAQEEEDKDSRGVQHNDIM